MRLLVFMTASAALWAQGPNIEELFRRAGAANDANGPKAQQYLYREYTVTTEINEGGGSNRHTETWEAIGLEGSEYRKLVQRDDKPLTEKEQKQEDDKLRKEGDRRRKEKRGGIKNPLKRTYTFGYSAGDERLFDFRYVGEEVVNGRPAYVLEGKPKSDVKPTNNHEKHLLLSRLKRWFDKEEFFESNFELEVTEAGGDFRPGTMVAGKQQRMEDGTWLMNEMHIRFILKQQHANARTELAITRSDFHKFAVDSRVLEPQSYVP
jgi:hypothetical protein